MSPTVGAKIEVLSTNELISDNELENFDTDRTSSSRQSENKLSCVPLKPILITVNSQKNIVQTKTKEINLDNNDYNKELKYYESIIDYLWDESLSTIPIFMKYFAFHEITVLICGAIYYFKPDIGVLCLSILPGLAIISVFMHFLLTQFKDINLSTINNGKYSRNESIIRHKIKSVFYSKRHYLVASSIFVMGLLSIYLIYQTNTYLSTLVPIKYESEMSDTLQFIHKILIFPYSHSMQKIDDESSMKPFNYRISFVGSIIAPIIEETFKYLLVSLTFPILFIWSFVYSKLKNKHGLILSKPTYADYCIESLFIMFIAVSGGCGIAVMENLGYLAACQWETTKTFCLPNKNFDILGAGLARGIFSVPFHCATACIMSDIVCIWMNSDIKWFNKNKYTLALKFILSYPISIIFPVFLHSSFNYWMKGIPFITGCITVFGFALLTLRISNKHSFINGLQDEEVKNKKKIEDKDRKSKDSIDLTLCNPFHAFKFSDSEDM